MPVSSKMMSIWRPFRANLAAWLAFSFLVLASSRFACAQLELIIVERPFHARHLAGIVSDSTGAPIGGVQVKICRGQIVAPVRGGCDQDPANILAATTTDVRGRFGFPKVAGQKITWLHLSSRGFDPMEVRVNHCRFAHGEVRIKLQVAN